MPEALCFGHVFPCYNRALFRNDRLAGANACAGSAVDALISVDHIDISGRDRLDRAFADTSTACNACVGNFVSHCLIDFVLSVRKYRNFI